VRNTELRCHLWGTSFNNTCCAKHRIVLSLVLQRLSITLVRNTELRCHWLRTAFIYSCAKHIFALSLLEQRLSITLVVRSRELRFHWWSNGFQLHLCETQNCVVTVVARAFNYTFAKHRIALSLVEQRLSITLLRSTELRCD